MGKIKHKLAGATNNKFVGLTPKIYLFLVDDSSEHKKAKGVNKNVVTTTGHEECKDINL